MRTPTIAIVSPSAPISTDEETTALVAIAERRCQENGLQFVYGTHARHKEALTSTVIKQKIADIYAAYTSTDTDIVMASQGGEKSIELLEQLDFELLRKHPKPLFGLSDITVLLNVISLMCQQTTYHGLDWIWGIGKNAGRYTLTQLKQFLAAPEQAVLQPFDRSKWVVVEPGMGRGKLLGGCLCSFNLLLGTRFDPLHMVDGDYILFFEDIGENFSRLAAMMRQIALHPKFSACKGIVLGNFFLCKNDIPDASIEAIAQQCFHNAQIPLLKIPEIGHAVENMILPIGKTVELTTTPTPGLTLAL